MDGRQSHLHSDVVLSLVKILPVLELVAHCRLVTRIVYTSTVLEQALRLEAVQRRFRARSPGSPGDTRATSTMRQPSLPSTTAPATSGTLQTRPLGSQLQRVFRPRTTSECNAGLPRRTRPRRGTVETAIRSRVRDEEMWTEVRAHGSVELVTVDGFSGPHSKLLLFLPGMDGTGLAIRCAIIQ